DLHDAQAPRSTCALSRSAAQVIAAQDSVDSGHSGVSPESAADHDWQQQYAESVSINTAGRRPARDLPVGSDSDGPDSHAARLHERDQRSADRESAGDARY